MTPEEIQIIKQQVAELYDNFNDVILARYKAGYIRGSLKYQILLKEERERSKKLLEALEEIRNVCPEKSWLYGRAEISITEYKNNNQ